MAAVPALKLLTTALVLAGVVAVLSLGALLVRHVAGQHGGLGLLAWSVGFAVLLPVSLAALAVVAPYAAHRRVRPIVPHSGWKVPGAGQ